MLIFLVPAAIASSITGIVNFAGTTTTTKSIGWPISDTLATHGFPYNSWPAHFGFTAYNSPVNPASNKFLKTTAPNFVGFSETPTTATDFALKKDSNFIFFLLEFN